MVTKMLLNPSCTERLTTYQFTSSGATEICLTVDDTCIFMTHDDNKIIAVNW